MWSDSGRVDCSRVVSYHHNWSADHHRARDLKRPANGSKWLAEYVPLCNALYKKQNITMVTKHATGVRGAHRLSCAPRFH